MQACRYVVQDCSNKSNPRIGISLQTSNSNFELALRCRVNASKEYSNLRLSVYVLC